MADVPRINELRRRVLEDSASIAFAQLAEEHRRLGEYEEAVRVCRAGLARHPGYPSARVTLGRSLLELGDFTEARAELELALHSAPDNLAALRALDELHQRREYPTPGPSPADNTVESVALGKLEGWLDAVLADRTGRL